MQALHPRRHARPLLCPRNTSEKRCNPPQARKQIGEEFARLRASRKELVAQLRSLTAVGSDADFDLTVDVSRQLRANLHRESRLNYRFQVLFVVFGLSSIVPCYCWCSAVIEILK